MCAVLPVPFVRCDASGGVRGDPAEPNPDVSFAVYLVTTAKGGDLIQNEDTELAELGCSRGG